MTYHSHREWRVILAGCLMLLTTAYTAGAAGNDGVQPQVVPNLLQNSCAFRRPSICP